MIRVDPTGSKSDWWCVIGVEKKIRQSHDSLRGQPLRTLTRAQCGFSVPDEAGIVKSDGYSDPHQYFRADLQPKRN